MRKISIIHFAPLEFYPPIQNLLNELGSRLEKEKIMVMSTRTISQKLSPFKILSNRIELMRIGKSDSRLSAPVRYVNYFLFFFTSFILLLWHRPTRILYFETISAWPAYIYIRFFKNDCQLFIHYHEYTSQEEYQKGMTLTRYFHQLEKWLYPRASWISHTNEFRMARFKKDIFPVHISSAQILPNYPPQKWHIPSKPLLNFPLKIVYVGALSLKTMFAREFAEWVLSQNGKATWDIFSYNCTKETEEYLQALKSDWISMHDGVDYDKLSSILKKYDIGVILYKGHIPNYVFNAPNKLFEYLACGLDVWFPRVMTGSLGFEKPEGFPKVLALDFSNLKNFNPTKVMDRNQLNNYSFFCEEVLRPLINKLTHD
jgi:hypothetical protein